MSQVSATVEKQKWFAKGITAGELIGYALTVLVIIGSAWKNIDTRLTILEQQQIRQDEKYGDIKSELVDIKDTQQKILIELQNKQNRQ